jgi:hypothetical protein
MKKKVFWTKYFMLKPGFSPKFLSVGLNAVIDLNNENTPIETLKKLYDMGTPGIALTEEGETKYFPNKVVKTTPNPEKKAPASKKNVKQ